MHSSALFFFSAIMATSALDAPAPAPIQAPAPAPLVDRNPACAAWAAAGECEVNPPYMLVTCAKTCTEKMGAATKAEPKEAMVETEAEIKEAEIKEAEIKKAEIKKAEVKKAEVKKAEVKKAEVKQEKTFPHIADLMEKPAEKPADKPAEKPADKPADKPAEKPVEDSSEPYVPTTVARSDLVKSKPAKTLFSTLLATATAKPAAKTLLSTLLAAKEPAQKDSQFLDNQERKPKTMMGSMSMDHYSPINFHEMQDKIDARKAGDKEAHGEKLSWHEKRLLEDVKRTEAMAISTSAEKVEKAAALANTPAVEPIEVEQQANVEQQKDAGEIRTSNGGSIGNYVFFSLVFGFFALAAGLAALQTELGKKVSIIIAGVVAGARMGTKTLGKVRGSLHRAASGDFYHVA